eukprot:2378347-Rhodomonas_salina.1
MEHDEGKIWGTTAAGDRLVEGKVRKLASADSTSAAVLDTVLAWWLDRHPNTQEGTWIAPMDAVARSFRKDQLLTRRVKRLGPMHLGPLTAQHL